MLITSQTYKAVLSQSGEDAPTAAVFKNTFPEMPTLSRESAGKYFLTFVNPMLPGNQTYIQFSSVGLNVQRADIYRILIETGEGGAHEDDYLNEYAIEVTVYSGWIE